MVIASTISRVCQYDLPLFSSSLLYEEKYNRVAQEQPDDPIASTIELMKNKIGTNLTLNEFAQSFPFICFSFFHHLPAEDRLLAHRIFQPAEDPGCLASSWPSPGSRSSRSLMSWHFTISIISPGSFPGSWASPRRSTGKRQRKRSGNSMFILRYIIYRACK